MRVKSNCERGNCMFGFSVYLNQALDNDTLVYIDSMKRAGFGGVFTSLHIPEDDANVLADRLAALQAACAKAELTLTADVSRTGLARMGVDFTDPAALRKLGVSCLRLDYGFTNAEIAQMSRVLPVALNASTLSADDLTALQVAGANRANVEAGTITTPGRKPGWRQAGIWPKISGCTSRASRPWALSPAMASCAYR